MIEAKIILDSISPDGQRITTMQIKFHRFVLAEFNTHRVFSRNFSSSRAIPTKKLLEQVTNDPAMPVWWGKNQAGMQANEQLPSDHIEEAKLMWLSAAKDAVCRSQELAEIGTHKQIVNRLIEPFMWVEGIVTSTDWQNFFDLRCHPDAQPEIQELAYKMRDALENSKPLLNDKWHLPYITEQDWIDVTQAEINNPSPYIPDLGFPLAKISAARCCRVSYLKHDGTNPSIEDDLALFDRLAGSVPIHASPLEHQALCVGPNESIRSPMSRNFSSNWYQFRALWERQMSIKS